MERLPHKFICITITPPPPPDLITWVFEEGAFIPQAKLQNGKSDSIICDHLGTPIMATDQNGKEVWQRQLDIYGKTRKLEGESSLIPFLYQGQYYDEETGLAYNRFRYYSPDSGTYLSQDPIGLAGGANVYAYVPDVNNWIDVMGLSSRSCPLSPSENKYYRYVGEGEKEVIERTGKIPNTDALGNPKKVYITNRKYKTAGKAKTHNQLPAKPKYRVEIDPEDVPDHKPFTRIEPDDNPDWGRGGGVESTTTKSIPVDKSKITILKGG